MADNADIATDNVQRYLDRTLADRSANALRTVAPECEDCGDPIAPERLAALSNCGCIRCVDCQALFEHKQKGVRHG
jgi:RNA polymerase-binding transcription factor DksA